VEREKKKKVLDIKPKVTKLYASPKKRGSTEMIIKTSKNVIFSHRNPLYVLLEYDGVVDVLAHMVHVLASFGLFNYILYLLKY
jgi:hypothetical protein